MGYMQICTLPQRDNHASIPPVFLQAGCPSCRPTNSIKALKALPTGKTASISFTALEQVEVQNQRGAG